MSRGPETTFIASVHKHLPESLYRIKNNNRYNGGQADCWYSGNKADLWVEYKFIVVPKRPETTVDIDPSALQQKWLKDRHDEGRNIGVIVGCKEGGVWLGGVEWDRPIVQKDFVERIKSRRELAEVIRDLTC